MQQVNDKVLRSGQDSGEQINSPVAQLCRWSIEYIWRINSPIFLKNSHKIELQTWWINLPVHPNALNSKSAKRKLVRMFLISRQEPEIYFIQNVFTYQPYKDFPVYYATQLKEEDTVACKGLLC